MVAYNIKSTSVAMLHAIIAPRDDTIRICQYTIIFLKTRYCPLVIKSFDHEGWAKFFAFPEGLETSCYHTATSDRGCGWEDYPTLTYCPTGSEHQALAVWQWRGSLFALSCSYGAAIISPKTYIAI